MPAAYLFGPFQLVPARRALLIGDRRQRLGSRAFDLLVALVQRHGRHVSNAELQALVWPETVVDPGALRVHMSALRKALGGGFDGNRYIVNEPSRGYCFIADVEALDADPVPVPTQEQPAGRVVASPLPVSPTRLFGRCGLVTDIGRLLPERRCVTVVGPGGVGKSALAIAAAGQVSVAQGMAGVFVELAPAVDSVSVLAQLSSALGLTGAADPLPTVIAFLREKRMLVLLDNCEHVLAETRVLIERLLNEAGQIVVLATSREPLGIDAEWVVRLPTLATPPIAAMSAAQAREFPAVALFAERAASNGFDFTEDDVASVITICRRLDGLPLAIELAAACVDQLGVAALEQLVSERLTLPRRGRRTALPRHQTLRATIDWSHELLSEPEKRLLRRLAVFRGRFTELAAHAISGDEPDRVADTLQALVAKSLVVGDVDLDPPQYRLLESTRDYAQEKLIAGGETDLALRRLTLFLRDHLQRIDADRLHASATSWPTSHAYLIPDVRAALAWAFGERGDHRLAVDLTARSATLWLTTMSMAEFVALADKALGECAIAHDSYNEMQLREAMGHACWHLRGAHATTSDSFLRALELADELGDDDYKLRSTWGLWLVATSTGDHPGAVALAEAFGRIVEQSGYDDAVIAHARMMALALHLEGRQAQALAYARRVLEAPDTANRASRGSSFQFDQRVAVHVVMARALWLLGCPDQAMAHARQAVDRASEVGHALSICYALASGAIPIALRNGDHATALRYAQWLVDEAQERSLEYWRHFGRCFLGVIQRDESPNSLNAEIVPSMVLREDLCIIDESLFTPALSDRANAGAGGWCQPELLRLAGLQELSRGDPEAGARAEALFKRGLTLAQDQQALAWQLRCATSLAALWAGCARAREGRDILDGVMSSLEEGHATRDVRRAAAVLSDLSRG